MCSAQEHSCAVCAWIAFVKMSCTMIYALVACASCQAPSPSCSLDRRTYTLTHACTPKVSSALFPKDLVYPLHSPFDSRL